MPTPPSALDWRALFEGAPGLFLVLDPELIIVGVSDAFLAATMRTRDQLVGQQIFTAFPDNPGDPDTTGAQNLRACLNRVRTSLVADSMPLQKYDLQRPAELGGGYEERYWSTTTKPILHDGELVAIVHRAEDVTEWVLDRGRSIEPLDRREAELLSRQQEVAEISRQLKESNGELSALYERSREVDALKSAFFANVSHELRTPLTLILGPTRRLLKSAPLTSQQLADLRTVYRNGNELLDLVNDLLETARLEAGQTVIAYSQLDLAALVRMTAGQFESVIAERFGALRVIADGTVLIEADPSKLRRVLLNLLSNAVKAIPPGGSVRVELRELPTGNVSIEVADSGAGVPIADRDLIFERFQQAPTYGVHRPGTGLGLAIAADLTGLHRGGIEVTDADEGGASFIVTLPRMAPPGVPVATPTQTMPQLNPTQGIPTQPSGPHRSIDLTGDARATYDAIRRGTVRPVVLVADDHPEMRQFMREELSDLAEVIVATDGRQAIALIEEHQPDLVIADAMMPGVDGRAVLSHVQSREALRDIPVVMVTARADSDYRIDLLRAGAADYVTKPFDADELRARVRYQLTQRVVATSRADFALHEPLTGLPNRSLLLDRVRQQVAMLDRSDRALGLIFADLEDFNGINERHGRLTADRILIAVAERLSRVVRPSDTVARLGSDEFVIACPEVASLELLEVLAERVRAVIAEPVIIGGHEFVVTAWVGTAYTSSSNRDAEALVHEAEVDMATRRADGITSS